MFLACQESKSDEHEIGYLPRNRNFSFEQNCKLKCGDFKRKPVQRTCGRKGNAFEWVSSETNNTNAPRSGGPSKPPSCAATGIRSLSETQRSPSPEGHKGIVTANNLLSTSRSGNIKEHHRRTMRFGFGRQVGFRACVRFSALELLLINRWNSARPPCR